MPSARRSSLLLAALAAAAACGGPTNSELKQHGTTSEDFLTVCAGSSTLPGVDVSSYQGTINWAKVAAAGIKFGYAKATEGTGFQDSTFPGNWSGMKANGVARGAYHFFHPDENGKTQADYYLAYVGAIGAGDLPPMLDWEISGSVSGATADANGQAFIDEIKAKTGKTTIIYTSPGLWSGFGTSGFGSYPMWVADYFNCYCNTGGVCPTTPSGWTSWVAWQYSDRGTVNGITGNVDLDEFNGTEAQLQALAGSADCGGKPNGTYCGNDGPQNADANSLYQCTSNQATLIQPCTGFCAKGTDADFCERPARPAHGPDVDGDGKADLCGRSATGMECWLSSGAPFSSAVTGPDLSDAAGWGALAYYGTLQVVDVNGDGKADVCGRGIDGAMCWLSNGTGFPTATNQGPMTDAAGWNKPEYRDTIQFADVNGDGKLDLCGRSATSFSCWLWNGNGFGGAQVNAPDMGDAQGWNVVQYYSTIVVADVTGDGKADVCGRGFGGFECWVSTGTSFTAAGGYVAAFSDANGGDQVSISSTIQLGDVDGDGKLDVCGRTASGFDCFKGDGNGKFSTQITGPALSNANGWNAGAYYSTIQLADVNGDGKADVCGRGASGVQCWLSNGTGFPTQISGPALSDAANWNAGVYDSTLTFADVDGDGRADVCGRSTAGWECWLSTGTGFATTPVTTTLLADAQNWDNPKYLTTIQLVGNAFGRVVATSSSTSSTSGSTGATTAGTTSAGSGATGSTTGSTSGSTGVETTSSSASTSGTSAGSTGSTHGSTGAASTSGTSGGATTGTPATTGAASGSVGGGDSSSSSTGGAKSGGCASAPGGSLLALMAVVQLLRRRRTQP